ncbi:hypothetical protein P9139_12125 [Curtobacterium flaccumfaciens]|nr:hypothetical protein P9139_12125 [Curtobacterium flaccumfaciens]
MAGAAGVIDTGAGVRGTIDVRETASAGETGAGVGSTGAATNGTVSTAGDVGAGGRRRSCGG